MRNVEWKIEVRGASSVGSGEDDCWSSTDVKARGSVEGLVFTSRLRQV